MRPFPHVLIADDEDAVRSLIARIVARTYPAVHVTLANDGADALRAFDHDPADLVITNYDMPGMNGLDLIRALRMRSATLPIVLVSADHALAPLAAARGSTAFVAKPFRTVTLQQVLIGLLPP